MDAHRTVIEGRVKVLWGYRSWYRTHLWADWTDLRRENDLELRALLKLCRAARDLEDAAPDPMTEAKGHWLNERDYTGWSEAEKAYGR